jgi:hypothetical protein
MPLWLQVIGVSVPTLLTTGGMLSLGTRLKWRSDCLQYTTRELHDQVIQEVLASAQKSWGETTKSLDQNLMLRIIGNKPLIKKKPLDYAIEGILDDIL